MTIPQIPFGTNNFAENPEPRTPCVLLLDTSGSMSGKPIEEVNNGLRSFKEDLLGDPLAAKRVEVAIITFGSVKIASEFHSAAMFQPPVLEASGDTPMGQAIAQAVDLVQQRKDTYKANGIAYTRPWIFLITDGEPTERWEPAAAQVREGEASKRFIFFAVAVEKANMETLRQISVDREPLKMNGLRFREFFKWLSTSLGGVARSKPEDTVALPSPRGWAVLPPP